MSDFTLVQETLHAFSPFYLTTFLGAMTEGGVTNDWFWLNMARANHPEPLTLADVEATSPYLGRRAHMNRLNGLVEKGLLTNGGEQYELTDNGRSVVEGLFERVTAVIGEIEQPEAANERLLTLLQRLVKATLSDTEVAKKATLHVSRWTAPDKEAPLTVQIDQFLTDLAHYRDDAHIAAWRALGVSGPAWNILTYVWREGVETRTALKELFPFQQFDEAELQTFCEELNQRAWLKQEEDALVLTELGRQVREEAEVTTERNFLIGWSALNAAEKTELNTLLIALRDELRLAYHRRVWAAMQNTFNQLGHYYQSEVHTMLEKMGLNPGDWFLSLVASARKPQPLMADYLHRLGPYSHVKVHQAALEGSMERGALAQVGNGYKVTEKGLAGLANFLTTARDLLAAVDTGLTEEEMKQTADFLNKLSDAVWAAAKPADKSRISNSHHVAPAIDAPALVRIDQYLTDLVFFRDDAHVAAWLPYGVTGEAWEALTFIWRDEANTAEALAEKLPQRQHGVDGYRTALQMLAEKGWLEKQDEQYRLTEAGRQVREEAEATTDAFFFGAWSALNHQEARSLYDLLLKLAANLQPEEA